MKRSDSWRSSTRLWTCKESLVDRNLLPERELFDDTRISGLSEGRILFSVVEQIGYSFGHHSNIVRIDNIAVDAVLYDLGRAAKARGHDRLLARERFQIDGRK